MAIATRGLVGFDAPARIAMLAVRFPAMLLAFRPASLIENTGSGVCPSAVTLDLPGWSVRARRLRVRETGIATLSWGLSDRMERFLRT